MAVVLPYPTLGPGVVDSAELVSNFSALASKFGSIDDNDIKANAGISLSKLAASYEYVTVNLVHTSPTGGLITAGRILASAPLYNDSKGAWTAVNYAWACNDCGAGTGAFNLKWGYVNASGTLVTTTTLKSGELLDGGTANAAFQDGGTLGTSLAWTQNTMCLIVDVNTADATAISTAHDRLQVAVLLKRQITT